MDKHGPELLLSPLGGSILFTLCDARRCNCFRDFCPTGTPCIWGWRCCQFFPKTGEVGSSPRCSVMSFFSRGMAMWGFDWRVVFKGRHSTVGRMRLLCHNYDGCDKLTASYFVTRGGGIAENRFLMRKNKCDTRDGQRASVIRQPNKPRTCDIWP